MAHCAHCGQHISDSASFCANCGKPVEKTQAGTQRSTVYDGVLHKCPNCGEILEAFQVKCPSCGYELRDSGTSCSVSELAMKLQQIENGRKATKNKLFGLEFASKASNDVDEQKINLIQSYVIPNTKEDILEFAILAASNVNKDAYDFLSSNSLSSSRRRDRQRSLSDAWLSKLEQAYQKAKIVLAGDERLNEIQALHDSTHKSVKRAKWNIWKVFGAIYAAGFILFIIIYAGLSLSQGKEVRRLDAIEEAIEAALDDGDYRYALMNAERLVYSGGDSDQKRDWRIRRSYWIDKVIEEAGKNGVVLDRPAEAESPDENISELKDLMDAYDALMKDDDAYSEPFSEDTTGLIGAIESGMNEVLSSFAQD